jgi:hypothetical protein
MCILSVLAEIGLGMYTILLYSLNFRRVEYDFISITIACWQRPITLRSNDHSKTLNYGYLEFFQNENVLLQELL